MTIKFHFFFHIVINKDNIVSQISCLFYPCNIKLDPNSSTCKATTGVYSVSFKKTVFLTKTRYGNLLA